MWVREQRGSKAWGNTENTKKKGGRKLKSKSERGERGRERKREEGGRKGAQRKGEKRVVTSPFLDSLIPALMTEFIHVRGAFLFLDAGKNQSNLLDEN